MFLAESDSDIGYEKSDMLMWYSFCKQSRYTVSLRSGLTLWTLDPQCKFASWRVRQGKLPACFAPQNAACGVMPHAVLLLSLLALACAVPRRNALACLR